MYPLVLMHARNSEGMAEETAVPTNEISQEQFLHLYGELVRQQVRLSVSLSVDLVCVCVCVCVCMCVYACVRARVYQYA